MKPYGKPVTGTPDCKHCQRIYRIKSSRSREQQSTDAQIAEQLESAFANDCDSGACGYCNQMFDDEDDSQDDGGTVSKP